MHPLLGPLPLLPPFFSSPEATVTATWPPLLAPPSQGLPWAGPLTSFGKSGLTVIDLSVLPEAEGSLPPQTPSPCCTIWEETSWPEAQQRGEQGEEEATT